MSEKQEDVLEKELKEKVEPYVNYKVREAKKEELKYIIELINYTIMDEEELQMNNSSQDYNHGLIIIKDMLKIRLKESEEQRK